MTEIEKLQAYALAHPTTRADGELSNADMRELPGGWLGRVGQ